MNGVRLREASALTDRQLTSSLSCKDLCMEIKGSMGLPPSAPGGLAASFNGMHAKGGEMPAHEPHTHAHAQQHASSPFRVDASRVTSTPMMVSPPIAVTPLAASPLPYMPDMSTAIMSHTTTLANLGPGFTGSDSVKKKRGRPRKYGPDGTVSIVIKPFSSPSPTPMSTLQKRGRGRPPGSGKNQQLAALGELICGTAGAGFTPHAITVATGEDVAARIMSFSQQGPRGICILSANGAISNVTLRQPSTSGGTVTYEGRFEILSLSGSFLVMDSNGTRSRTGGLSVSLAGPDGRVVGGGVAGMLTAASPVQVVVGSFICGNNSKKVHSKQPKVDSANKLSASSTPKDSGVAPEMSLNKMADMKPESPLNQSSGNGGSSDAESPQGQMIAVHSGWPASHGISEGRHNIEIAMSSPGQ
ncbi:hypothetical protein GOP47_0010734 [Adiantum capillus-veneris]|uniref:AT-hook motif nuclear-localized protein n=1 Tax=Adiantum capillus-veneris TaxID=13818 RepID=A0A9D4UVH3_ADICA|nr:hypothetical protein GOP47_0010734 [Adiantum capillus-veneris]